MESNMLYTDQDLDSKDVLSATNTLLDKLNQLTRSDSCNGPCTNVWVAGSYAVRCRTCQRSNTSAICLECFRAGDHEGHDYCIYPSPAGGACDCGDLSSFSYEGCCPRHKPARAGQGGHLPSLLAALSPSELQAFTHILESALVRLAHVMVRATALAGGFPSAAAAAASVADLSRWLCKFASLTPVRPLACRLAMGGLCARTHACAEAAAAEGGGVPEAPSCLAAAGPLGTLSQALGLGPEEMHQSYAMLLGEAQHLLCDSAVAGRAGRGRSIGGGCTHGHAIPSDPSVLSILLRLLPDLSSQHKDASVALTTLLLLLLYDSDCKHYTSVHILSWYSDFLSRIMADQKPNHPLTTALDRLTVQLFNSEDVTFRLVQENSLLQILLDMQLTVIDRVLDLLNTAPANEVHGSALLSESKVLWHCLRRVQGDLNGVLHYPSVAAAFVLLPDVRSKFLECMARAQLMQQHHRKTSGDMVPMPSFKVQCALNLEMVMLSTVPELEGALSGKEGSGGCLEPGPRVHLLHQAASCALEAAFKWATGQAVGSSPSPTPTGSSSIAHGSSSIAHGTGSSGGGSGSSSGGSSGSRLLDSLSQLMGQPFPPVSFLSLLSAGHGAGGAGADAARPSLPAIPPTKVFWEALMSGSLGVSAHLPLHRTLAGLLLALINAEHSPAPQVAASASQALQALVAVMRTPAPHTATSPRIHSPPASYVWQHVQRHVLLLQCFFMQVRLRLWILNGDDISILSTFYQGFRELRDLDLLLLQFGLAAGPPGSAAALVELLYGLGAGPLLHSAGVCPRPPNEPTPQHLADRRRLRGCECALQLLLVLLRDRVTCGAPRARVRQLLLQWLAIQDTGYSQLVQGLPQDLQQACGPQVVEEVLKDLATFRSPSLAASGTFMLKAQAWRSFDPHSSLYTPTTKQKAMERAVQAGFRPHWQLNPPSPLPPCLEPMRAVLLLPELYALVHHILVQAVSPSPLFSSDDLTLSALNLLALQLHYTQELIGRSVDPARAGSSSSSLGSSSTAKEAASLAASSLLGGPHAARCFQPSLLELLVQKAGPVGAAAATSGMAPSAAAAAQAPGEVDEVADCCCCLLKLAQEVLRGGRAAGLLPGPATAAAATAVPQSDGAPADDAAAAPASGESDMKSRAKAKQAEAMAKLRAQQAAFLHQAGVASSSDSDTEMAEAASPAGAAAGGQPPLSGALDEDTARLGNVLGFANTSLQQLQQQQPQQQQMQQLQQQEEAFPVHGCFVPWTGTQGSSSDGECVVCRQAGCRSAPLGWLGHLQTSGTLVHSLVEPRRWNETDNPSSSSPSPSSISSSSLPQAWARCVAGKGPWAACGADWAPGLHVLCCGHQMHLHCFRPAQHRGLSMHASARHREATCPVCRRLANVLLPAADFQWRPKPLHAGSSGSSGEGGTAGGLLRTMHVVQPAAAAAAAPAAAAAAGLRLTQGLLPASHPLQAGTGDATTHPPGLSRPGRSRPDAPAEAVVAEAAFAHLAPMMQSLVGQARLEMDLHMSSLDTALRRRATMVEHGGMQAGSLQQQQQQQQQQQEQQQEQVLMSSWQHGGAAAAYGAWGGRAGGEAGEQEAMPDTAQPQAPVANAAGVGEWACAVQCSTIAEVRASLWGCPPASLLWSMLAHNLAHWEAMHRPVDAAPVFDLSATPSSGGSTRQQQQQQQQQRAGAAAVQGAGGAGSCTGLGAEVSQLPPVVDAAHWRALRALSGTCLALGCMGGHGMMEADRPAGLGPQSQALHVTSPRGPSSSPSTSSSTSSPSSSPSSSSSSGSYQSAHSALAPPPIPHLHAARQLQDALRWLLGAEGSMQPPPLRHQQLPSQAAASQGSFGGSSGAAPLPVGIPSGLLPRYDPAAATAALRQERAEGADAWYSAERAPAALQTRRTGTWQTAAADPFLLLLELLALGSSAFGGEAGLSWAAPAAADAAPSGSGGGSSLWGNGPTAGAAAAAAAQARLACGAAAGSHGLLAGVVGVLLPLCAVQGAVWACLAWGTCEEGVGGAAGAPPPDSPGQPPSLTRQCASVLHAWLSGGSAGGGHTIAHQPSTHTAAAAAAAAAAASVGQLGMEQHQGSGEAAQDAALLEAAAASMLPFLVRAYALHCALRPHTQPDARLMQAYTRLQPAARCQEHHRCQQQQPVQQQEHAHSEANAHSLVDQLCTAMGLPPLHHALSTGLAAVAACDPASTCNTAPQPPHAPPCLLAQWCGHLLWAHQAQQQQQQQHASSSSSSSSHSPAHAAGQQAEVGPSAAHGHQQQQQQQVQGTSGALARGVPCPLPAPPSLIPLPPLFQDLLLFYEGKVCAHCRHPPEHPCLCLATGQLLCSWWTGCVEGRGGGTLHAVETCTGSTLMLSLKSTKVVALRGPRVMVVQSPYLDAHGEEDYELRRGRPLYLQPRIYAHLARLWSCSALEYDSVLLHSSRTGLDLL